MEVPSTQSLLERIRVVAVVSAKGGVGKTTLSASLASAMQRAGRPVLALDLDPQNALQHHFKAIEGVGDCSALGIAHGEQDWHSCGMPSDSGVFVLPYGDIDEARRLDFEQQLQATPDWLAQRLVAMELVEGSVVFIFHRKVKTTGFQSVSFSATMRGWRASAWITDTAVIRSTRSSITLFG